MQNETLGNVSLVETGTTGVITELEQFSGTYGSVSITGQATINSDSQTFACDSCTDLSASANRSIDEINVCLVFRWIFCVSHARRFFWGWTAD